MDIEERFLQDDALWSHDAFRRVGREYDVETGLEAQAWYEDRRMPVGPLDRKVDRIEAQLPRIAPERYRSGAYTEAAVDELYTLVDEHGPEPAIDACSASSFYGASAPVEEVPEAVFLDENVLYDMILCEARTHGRGVSLEHLDGYDTMLEDLPGPRDHEIPWNTGYALLDEVLGRGVDVYFPDKTTGPFLEAYGPGKTQEIYDRLEAIGTPVDVSGMPKTNHPDISAMWEDTVIAEEARARDALVVTNDNDFSTLIDAVGIDAAPPDLVLYGLAE